MILLPLVVFFLSLYGGIILYSKNRPLRKAILRTADIILSESELQRKKDGALITYTSDLLPKIEKYIRIEEIYGNRLKKMLRMMGEGKSFERIFADHVISAFLGGLGILILPVITGFWGYIVLYPFSVLGMMIYQYFRVAKRFKAWQTEVIKDIPELIDKMRISLASGKDYISSLKKVQENSGPRLSIMLEKLINDMQIMRPTQALDEFGNSFGMPVMVKFVAAVKVGIEVGYEQAENYFIHIEQDIREIRKIALEELTKNKPEKVMTLYALMAGHAIASLILIAFKILGNVSEIL
jgi:hypothetical protein